MSKRYIGSEGVATARGAEAAPHHIKRSRSLGRHPSHSSQTQACEASTGLQQTMPSSMRRVASVSTIRRLTHHPEGETDTTDYRLHSIDHDAQRISLWHELPLFAVDDDHRLTGSLNFICEIPKFTRRKFEICTTEEGNPIKQDQKNGKPRVFSKGDIFFNYGCFPRTWEDPNHIDPDVGCGGDNDPLDVCEIGLAQIKTGCVKQVKVLGVLCLIDDGETDWKVIAIDVEDRWAPELNDIEDVERLLPGTLDAIRDWFRTYKIPDGKPPNKFGLGERFMGVKYTMRVIRETHYAWKKLVTSMSDSPKTVRKVLSVPSLHQLDMTTDHHAVEVILKAFGDDVTKDVASVGLCVDTAGTASSSEVSSISPSNSDIGHHSLEF